MTTDYRVLTRRERKRRETRRRIYSAAFELFLEKGFENTRVEEIAERADVGKGTVFNYFPHKRSFLAALADEWLDRLAEEMGPVEQLEGSVRESLERVYCFLADLAVANPELAHQALFESLRSMYEGGIEDEKPIRDFHDITLCLLEKGQKNHEVRRDMASQHTTELLEAAFHRTLVRWLREPRSVGELHEAIAVKLDIIFDGIAPQNADHQARKHRSERKRSERDDV